MNQAFSVFLDALRLITAIVVVLYHARDDSLGGDALAFGYQYGWDAVKVLFVLSGFVIAHVTETKAPSWLQFSRDRLSRLYSVVVPALILTVLADLTGEWVNADFYNNKRLVCEYPITGWALHSSS